MKKNTDHYARITQTDFVFDAAAAARALLRLDLSVYAPPRGVLADYVRFYGLDLERTLPAVRHYVGSIDAYGYQLAAHVFMPAPENTKGTVFIFHGYFDHAGLYTQLIADCVERGYAVFIYDLPGHGLSSGARADIPEFSHYQCILDSVLAQYGAELPAPFFAVGQSTGGAILMDHVLSACAQKKSPAFKKITLLAPLVRPAQWQKIRLGFWLLHWLRRSVPRVFRRNSSDESFLYFLRAHDPLQEKKLPLHWVGALKRWVPYVQALPPCDFSVFLVQGDQDDTVEWRSNIKFVQRHFSVEHAWLVAGASHHLANESSAHRAYVHAALEKMLP